MALIDSLILPKPLVMISQGTSQFSAVPESGINFGQIVKIYETADRYAVGEIVAYSPIGQKIVGYSLYKYALIDEANILYSEGQPI